MQEAAGQEVAAEDIGSLEDDFNRLWGEAGAAPAPGAAAYGPQGPPGTPTRGESGCICAVAADEEDRGGGVAAKG